jgi:phenylacetate-CoA ligase
MLRFDTVFKGVKNIREAQVVQERVDVFTIHVVPAEGFNNRDIQTIKSNIRLHVGAVHTEVKSISAIPRTPSGKFRAVICNLSDQEKQRMRQLKSLAHDSVSATAL